VFVLVGHRLHLTCEASHERAVFSWSRNVPGRCEGTEQVVNGSQGFIIDNSSGLSTSELTKYDVRWADEAKYICRSIHNSYCSVHVAVIDGK